MIHECPTRSELCQVGYRVLGVQPNSPAAVGGLVSFFDFIVAANGISLATLDNTFVNLIKVKLDYFNTMWLIVCL